MSTDNSRSCREVHNVRNIYILRITCTDRFVIPGNKPVTSQESRMPVKFTLRVHITFFLYRGVQMPATTKYVSPTTTSVKLSVNQSQLSDGDTIVVWLRANGFVGNPIDVGPLLFQFDRSIPKVNWTTFQRQSKDDYTSR